MATRVAINGFGRIGRLAFRQMFGAEGYEVVAINDLTSPKMLAHLLKYDSAQGRYNHEVEADDTSITVDGTKIEILAEKDPANLPWAKIGVDVVLECTGFFASKEKSQAHINAGAKKVVISAPAGNDLPRDGTLYAKDLREKFPSDVPWDTELGHDGRMAENYRKACKHFGLPMQTTTTEEAMPAPTTTAVYVDGQAEDIVRETYIYNTGEALFGRCELIISSDGTAVLTFGYLSSYIAVGSRVDSPQGTYAFVTDDGYDNKYFFSSYGSGDNCYYFVADESSPVPKFKPSADADAVVSIPDGAEFVRID